MTNDAIMLNRDTPRAAGLRPFGEARDIYKDLPSRKSGNHFDPNIEEKPKELGSKGKAWAKWIVNLVGDTVTTSWSGKTFTTPKEGIHYQAKTSSGSDNGGPISHQ